MPDRYAMISTRFGAVSIVWSEIKEVPRIHRVFLPDEEASADAQA